MICRGCRSVKNQGTKGVDHAMTLLEGLPESGFHSSFQYCWWSPKVADGVSWWLTASTPSHWWHCSFHILHSITLFPALDAEMCHFLFSNCIPHLQWVLVHFLDKTGYPIWFSCHSTSISCVHITTTTYEKFLGTARRSKTKNKLSWKTWRMKWVRGALLGNVAWVADFLAGLRLSNLRSSRF